MKVKILQADTRPIKIYLESRNLKYGPPNQMDFQMIASINNNVLIQPNDAISLARMVNVLKCRMMSMAYEHILGKNEDWNEGDKRGICWIKVGALMDQMKKLENKDVELFCFLDSDAWIRDEREFQKFCNDFLASPELLGVPRDLELEGSSLLNAGVIFIKNKPAALAVLEAINTQPEYRKYDKACWWEGSALSDYSVKYPGVIQVLSLNDFNTPCGRIIRHCWTKHLIDHFVIEEIVATLTRIAIGPSSDPNYVLGPNVMLFPAS